MEYWYALHPLLVNETPILRLNSGATRYGALRANFFRPVAITLESTALETILCRGGQVALSSSEIRTEPNSCTGIKSPNCKLSFLTEHFFYV
jgi:hypothetical protein